MQGPHTQARTPADGRPVTANRPRMGSQSGFSGGRTPKMGFRLAMSNMEPTCSRKMCRRPPSMCSICRGETPDVPIGVNSAFALGPKIGQESDDVTKQVGYTAATASRHSVVLRSAAQQSASVFTHRQRGACPDVVRSDVRVPPQCKLPFPGCRNLASCRTAAMATRAEPRRYTPNGMPELPSSAASFRACSFRAHGGRSSLSAGF